MVQPDRKEFFKAMVKKIVNHQKHKHCQVVPINSLPDGVKLLDLIWAMQSKRLIGTGEVSKYKARLNAHEGQKEYGVNYWETFSPVVQRTTNRQVIML